MNKAVIALICVGFAQNAQAAAAASEYVEKPSDLKIALGGTLDTQAGYRSQKKAFNKDAIQGDSLHKGAIVNETRLNFDIQGKVHNLKYGGYIQLFSDASAHYVAVDPKPRIGKKLFSFVETRHGRAEFGGGQSASAQMQVSANNIARLPGGINGRAQKWMSDFVYLPNATGSAYKFTSHFIRWPTLPIDNEHEAAAGKVTYFTPKVEGFQVGISYVVDSELHGTVAKTHSIYRNNVKEYNDIFDGAIKYEGKFNEIVFATALIGQMGKAKSLERNDLRAWELGALAKYKGFSAAGSYSDWHHSGTPKSKVTGQKHGASYWTAGIGYEQGDLGTSITYFNSIRANSYNNLPVADLQFRDTGFNRFELLCLGVDYKLAPGFMPYAELSLFRTNHRGAALSNKGTIMLAGTKLAF